MAQLTRGCGGRCHGSGSTYSLDFRSRANNHLPILPAHWISDCRGGHGHRAWVTLTESELTVRVLLIQQQL